MNIKELPESIPVFPLNGALLLPGGDLPLNIFEPRYLEMINFAMKNHKMIGMIQENSKKSDVKNLYTTGCLGKITRYNETDDGRYLINLHGIIRFNIKKELETNKKFREFNVGYENFSGDFIKNYKTSIKKNEFLKEAQVYLSSNDINIDWGLIKEADQTLLITVLASICPFSIAEKQMLLECRDKNDIANKMLSLFKMNLNNNQPSSIN